MSAGGFTTTKYESNTGLIHPIRLQPETVGFAIGGDANNAAPTAGLTSDFSVRVSRGNTEYGLRPRKLNIKFGAVVPDGYKAEQTYAIPILVPEVWEAAGVGDAVTYLGVGGVIVGKSPESIR